MRKMEIEPTLHYQNTKSEEVYDLVEYHNYIVLYGFLYENSAFNIELDTSKIELKSINNTIEENLLISDQLRKLNGNYEFTQGLPNHICVRTRDGKVIGYRVTERSGRPEVNFCDESILLEERRQLALDYYYNGTARRSLPKNIYEEDSGYIVMITYKGKRYVLSYKNTGYPKEILLKKAIKGRNKLRIQLGLDKPSAESNVIATTLIMPNPLLVDENKTETEIDNEIINKIKELEIKYPDHKK